MNNNTKQLHTEIITLSDYALIDKDNKVSIMGIFDEIRSEKFPCGFIDKFFVATIQGVPNKTYRLVLELNKEGQNKNLLNPTVINATIGNSGKHNIIVRLANVGFEAAGSYYFSLHNGSEEVGSFLLKVIDAKHRQETAIRMPN